MSHKLPPPPLWRQGDVFIVGCTNIPSHAAPARPVLAEGELTGHAHRLDSTETATVLRRGSQLFLRVTGPSVTILHEEHGPVTIPQGEYEVRIQREYHPKEIRQVID